MDANENLNADVRNWFGYAPWLKKLVDLFFASAALSVPGDDLPGSPTDAI